MPLICPFTALRPAPGRAGEVIAPPYDVVNTEEARLLAEGRPWSFLHISRPEIDLPPGSDPHAPEAYAKAAENLEKMIESGVLQRDDYPCYYAYRLATAGHEQTGLVVVASVEEYDSNRIRRHEFTRPDKEDDRVRHIDALDVQTGPALLAYPNAPEIDALIAEAASGDPDDDTFSDTGVRHTLWVVSHPDIIDEFTNTFDKLPALYIADGHHRTAAASRIAARRRQRRIETYAASDYFLAVIFPHHQMRILDYNRVVWDLGHQTEAEFLQRVAEKFSITPSSEPVAPDRPGHFGLYLSGQWRRLVIRPKLIPEDPVGRLDVSLLQAHVIGPLLGIEDPRRDPRIDFVGGIRGLKELERRVDNEGMALAFSMCPTRMDDLMAVADAGEVMPPKSTWFEPKLADGMASHILD